MKISHFLAFALLILQPLFVSADEAKETATCDQFTTLSVADFDGNGTVNSRDIAMLAKVIRKNKRIAKRNERIEERNARIEERRNSAIEKRNSRRSRHNRDEGRGEERSYSRRLKELKQIVYSPLFDRNNDGEIDGIDMHNAALQMGQDSTPEDQELVAAYNEFLEDDYVCAGTTEVIVGTPSDILIAEPR